MLGLLEDLLKERPRLAKWWIQMEARPSFKNTGFVSFGLGIVMLKRISGCAIL